jgi:Domain of unknown function (DUF4167)
VRQGQQNRRGRGRNNRKSQNPLSRSFESNGPEMKIRGTPAHIAEKYLTLARDAQSSGDPVLAENYLQHAEHYIRIIMAYREQFNQPGDAMNGSGPRTRPEGAEGGEEFGDDDGEDILDEVFQQPQFQQHQPTHQHGGRQGGQHEGNRNEGYRQDRPFRRDNRGFRDRDRDRQHGDRDRQGGEGRPQATERPPQEHAAEGGEGRRRERFQQNDQPEFLRRPVRRARSDNDEAGSPAKDEPSRD